MARRILLVRAVNVGGAGSLPMAAFRALLAELGAEGVRTHLASGNAILDVAGDPEAFDRAVEAGMRERLDVDREVISRSPGQVRAALDAHPFEVADPAFSYIAFLDRAPSAERVEAARDLPAGEDRWAVVGAELHARFERGMGRAQLDLGRLLRTLGVVGTARNLRTVDALLRLADQEPGG